MNFRNMIEIDRKRGLSGGGANIKAAERKEYEVLIASQISVQQIFIRRLCMPTLFIDRVSLCIWASLELPL